MATRLFDGHGVHAVGMQQIIDEFGCGKAMLYREFATKDDLVVAYLERYTQTWDMIRERAAEQHPDDPAGQLLAIIDHAGECAARPGFRGCTVRNTHAEFPDEGHPAHEISVAYYDRTRADLADLAERAGAADPGTLADRLLLIIDGLNASAAVRGDQSAARSAVAFARDVVRAATS
ncbi:TetR/AcrR family transcriptional regulator [Kibdelosporangium lantanae]